MRKKYIVQDQYRTHELSLEPGGSSIFVMYNTGKTIEYDKIKYPDKYIKQLLKNSNITKIILDGKVIL
jgi:hypothetical protein